MDILLNGANITTNVESLAELLLEQGIETKGVAVAVNRRVIPRTEWEGLRLSSEDQVIVVSAVYGG